MDNVGEAPLIATIKFRSTSPPIGSLVIENKGSTDLRVWQPGNSWGDAALSFEVRVDDQSMHIIRVPLDYTRNVPASVTLPPGRRYELPFDLGNASWQPVSALIKLGRAGAQLEAIYDSGDSPEVQEQRIWKGKVRSGFYPLH